MSRPLSGLSAARAARHAETALAWEVCAFASDRLGLRVEAAATVSELLERLHHAAITSQRSAGIEAAIEERLRVLFERGATIVAPTASFVRLHPELRIGRIAVARPVRTKNKTMLLAVECETRTTGLHGVTVSLFAESLHQGAEILWVV